MNRTILENTWNKSIRNLRVSSLQFRAITLLWKTFSAWIKYRSKVSVQGNKWKFKKRLNFSKRSLSTKLSLRVLLLVFKQTLWRRKALKVRKRLRRKEDKISSKRNLSRVFYRIWKAAISKIRFSKMKKVNMLSCICRGTKRILRILICFQNWYKVKNIKSVWHTWN